MLQVIEKEIPQDLLDKILDKMGPVPFYYRKVKISKKLIKVTLEILNDAPSKTLPQNCKNDVRRKTPDGLDLRIKNSMDFDTRTANIISDVLADAGIVKVIQIINSRTGRSIKATHLLNDWTW